MVALGDTFGAALIGVIVATALYGFTCVQAWYYYTNYPLDCWYIKLLVAGILVSETCHEALITHASYTYLITYFGDNEQIGRIVWSVIAQIFFIGITAFIVQCFLAMRVYRLSKKRWLATGSVMILIVAEFLTIIVYGVKALRFDTFTQLGTLRDMSMTINGLAASGDLLIAMLLCFLLWISRTGTRKSDTLINKLVLFTTNTSLLTSLCALASLISIIVRPHSFIYMAFFLCIGRLYGNCLLATLNARIGLRIGWADDPSHSLSGYDTQPTVTDVVLGP